MTDLLLAHGLLLLFLLVAMESAGVPLPGETALVTAAILAQRGHYSLVSVIVVAAAAAIVGDNIGYWIGRKGGRALLRRTPIVRGYFERALPPSERFFRRHGPKTVFLGRFVAILRVTAAWLGVVRSVVIGGVATLVVAGVWSRLFPQLSGLDRFPSVQPAAAETAPIRTSYDRIEEEPT